MDGHRVVIVKRRAGHSCEDLSQDVWKNEEMVQSLNTTDVDDEKGHDDFTQPDQSDDDVEETSAMNAETTQSVYIKDGDGRDTADAAVTEGVLTSGKTCSTDKARRLLHTVVYYYAFFNCGWLVSQRGAAFLDLLLLTNTEVGLGSLLFLLSGLASVAGVVVTGFLLDLIPRANLLVAGAVLLVCVFNTAVPVCSVFAAMAALHFAANFALAAVDVATNSVMARLWGQSDRGYMQALHFMFAFGAVLSPLATQPFLAPRDGTSPSFTSPALRNGSTYLHTNGSEAAFTGGGELETLSTADISEAFVRGEVGMTTVRFSNVSGAMVRDDLGEMGNLGSLNYKERTSDAETKGVGSTLYNPHHLDPVLSENQSILNETTRMVNSSDSERTFPGKTRIFYAYLISSCMSLSAAVLLLALCAFPLSEREEETKEENSEDVGTGEKKLRGTRLVVIMLMCLHFYLASYIACPDLLMTFVVRGLNWSKASGARLISVFWVGLAAGRLSGVGLVRLLTPPRILAGCLTCLLVSFLGLLLASLLRLSHVVWVSVAAAGLFVAVLFPTAFMYTHEEVVVMTGRPSACVFSMAMMASMVDPPVLARLMGAWGPVSYVYFFMAKTGLALLAFGLVHALVVSRLNVCGSGLATKKRKT